MVDRIGILTLAALLAAGLAFAAGAYGQTTWYVDDDAPNDPGPGDPGVSDPDEDGSAEHPFDAIQEGIDAAVNGDEVVVADGTYTGYGNRDLDFGGKAITVRSENGPDDCVIDCEGGPDDWHRGFLFDNGETADARLQGLTITNGFLDSHHGGAIECVSGSPTIVDCRVIGNTAGEYGWGGGIYCGGTTAVVDCTFVANAADIAGGACGWGSATFTNCAFSGNTGYVAGGGYFLGSVVAVNCTFSANVASYSGGIRCRGNVRISDCVISDNFAYERAGGLSCWEGAAITRCMIVGNHACGDEYEGPGGGIYCVGDDVTITDCVIANNYAPQGGGIYSDDGSPAITGCLLAMNWAFYGAGIRVSYGAPTISNCLIVGDRSYSPSTAVSIAHGDPTIANCTITGHWQGVVCSSGTSTVTNCILWDNTTGGIVCGTASVTYSDIEGGWEGTGNIDVDPLFADPNGPDGDPNTWEDNDYHLLGDSACIDGADNTAVPAWVTSDLDGRLRFADRIGTPDTGNPGAPGRPIVDMGAYEYQCTGDLDGDGEIDLLDLAALLAHYGTTSSPAYADGDLDQDGDVDLSDLATLLAAYGPTCEWVDRH